MNIKEQTSITSGSRFYRFALVEDAGRGFLTINSHPLGSESETHLFIKEVGAATNRISVGTAEDNGFYCTLQSPVGSDKGTWFYIAAEEELLQPGRRHFRGGQMSGAEENLLCNSQSPGFDPRHLCVDTSDIVMGIITIRAKHEAVRAHTPRMHINIPVRRSFTSQPPHHFSVQGEVAVIRAMQERGEYEYRINLNGRPNTTDQAFLVSEGYVPAAVSTNPADLNNDGRVDTSDIAILLDAFRTQDQAGDLNRDGVVDSGDLGVLLGSMNKQ